MRENSVVYFLIGMIAAISMGFALLYERLVFKTTNTELIIFVGIFVVIVIVCLVGSIRRKSDPYEVINPVLIIYSLYALMLPLNYLVSLRIPTFEINVPGAATLPIFQYLVICMIGLIGLLIGYHLPFGRRFAQKIPVWEISMRELKIAALILLVVGIISFATRIAGYGGFYSYIKVGYGPQRYVIQREAVAFGHGLEMIGIATILLMLVTLKEKRRRWPIIILVFILICFVIISLLIGQRRFIVYLLIMGFVIFNYGVFRVKLKWTLLAAVLAYGFFFIFAHSRAIWAEFGLIRGITETYNIAVKKPVLFLPFAGGAFIPPSKLILEILTDNSFQFTYGSSYIIAFLRLIPRIGKMMPETLQTLSEWRMNTYYPGLWARGINFNFFTAAEGYTNFGYFGVLVHMAFYGFIAKTVYSYFRENRANTLVLIAYAAIFPLVIFEGIHAEFSQVLWHTVHTNLGPIILIVVLVKFVGYVSTKYRITII